MDYPEQKDGNRVFVARPAILAIQLSISKIIKLARGFPAFGSYF